MAAEKRCPKCGILKPATGFYQIASRHDGLSSYCRQCQLADAKGRYDPHPRWKPPAGQKWCAACETIKPLDAFGSNRSAHDGKQGRCKPCCIASVTASRRKNPTAHRASSRRWREENLEQHADMHARWRYGAEPGSYARMLAEQGGKCAICEATEPGPRLRRFHIDHCHDTGIIRGLLCAKCNTGIGQLMHDPRILEAALVYLKKYSQVD